MRRITVIAIMSLVALVATATTASANNPGGAGPISKESCPVDDYGNCMGVDPYAAYYEYDETGEDSVEYYGGGYNCKVVHAIRTVRNIYWVILFQYVEQVRWCFNGDTVTEFTRWRWPQSMTFGMWSFDSDIGNSCESEYCQEQTGSWVEHAWTEGQFRPNWCPFNFCGSRHPTVDIGVNANGGWGARTNG